MLSCNRTPKATRPSSFRLALTAGSLFVFGFRWEGATGSGNATGSQQGGGALTMLTRVDNAAGDHHAQMGYLLTNNAAETFNLTFPASSGFLEASGAEFSYTGTPTIDTSNTGSGSGTALASGAITLDSSAADWLAVGFGSSYSSGQTYSRAAMNGVAAAGSVTRLCGLYDALLAAALDDRVLVVARPPVRPPSPTPGPVTCWRSNPARRRGAVPA